MPSACRVISPPARPFLHIPEPHVGSPSPQTLWRRLLPSSPPMRGACSYVLTIPGAAPIPLALSPTKIASPSNAQHAAAAPTTTSPALRSPWRLSAPVLAPSAIRCAVVPAAEGSDGAAHPAGRIRRWVDKGLWVNFQSFEG
jgi:hypothetical protein